MSTLQRNRKAQLCQEKKTCRIVIHLKIRVSDERDEKHWLWDSAREHLLGGSSAHGGGTWFPMGGTFLPCSPRLILLTNPLWRGFLLCCFSPFGCAYAGGFITQVCCLLGDPQALIFTGGSQYLAWDFWAPTIPEEISGELHVLQVSEPI